MPTSVVYELRPKPQGRGWGAYLVGEPDRAAPSEPALDRFFAERLRLRDLPRDLPWIGALRMPSGSWIVAWHAPAGRRLSALLLAPEEWEEAEPDLGVLVARQDPSFARDHLSSSFSPVWAVGGEGWPGHPLGGSCAGYLPLALTFLRLLRAERTGPSVGCATAWQKGVPRPVGLAACPFEVIDGGPASLDLLMNQLRSAGALADPASQAAPRRLPAGDVGELEPARIEALEAGLRQVQDRLRSLELRYEERVTTAPEAKRLPWYRSRRGLAVAIALALAVVAVPLLFTTPAGSRAADLASEAEAQRDLTLQHRVSAHASAQAASKAAAAIANLAAQAKDGAAEAERAKERAKDAAEQAEKYERDAKKAAEAAARSVQPHAREGELNDHE